MSNLINHPLFATFTMNPLLAYGCVGTVIGLVSFAINRSFEAALLTIAALAFTIVPEMRLF